MSMYGEDGETGYYKEDLRYSIDDFLEHYDVAELLRIVADAVEAHTD